MLELKEEHRLHNKKYKHDKDLSPHMVMDFDTYLKFDIFISKQKISEFGKYFAKAAADAPAYEPISKTFNSFFLKCCNCSS